MNYVLLFDSESKLLYAKMGILFLSFVHIVFCTLPGVRFAPLVQESSLSKERKFFVRNTKEQRNIFVATNCAREMGTTTFLSQDEVKKNIETIYLSKYYYNSNLL